MFAANPDDAASKIVDAFFVDSITACGSGSGPNIVGCANRPGHDLVVKSSYAATDTNEIDLGHELGHNLGLDHVADPTNLINPVLLGGTTLTSSQFTTILGSALFQVDPNGDNDYFINIRPILIAASTPLPAAWGMMTLGLGVGGFVLKRRKAKAGSQKG